MFPLAEALKGQNRRSSAIHSDNKAIFPFNSHNNLTE